MNKIITKTLVLIGGCWTLKTVVEVSYGLGYIKGMVKCEDMLKENFYKRRPRANYTSYNDRKKRSY